MQKYAIPLGAGVNLSGSTNPEAPQPSVLKGLVPISGGRLYAFGGTTQLTSNYVPSGYSLAVYDHYGIGAFLHSNGDLRLFKDQLRPQTINIPNSPTDLGTVPSVGFWERAGVIGYANLRYALWSTALGKVVTSSSSTGSWTINLTSTTGGSLPSGGNLDYNILVLECIATPAGRVVVNVHTDGVTTGAADTRLTVAGTTTGNDDTNYREFVIYVQDMEVTTASQALLASIQTGPSNWSVNIDAMPLGETMPDGNSGVIVTNTLADGAFIAHGARYYGISGLATWRVPVTTSSPGTDSGQKALLRGRSVVYTAPGGPAINLASDYGYFTPRLTTSSRLTALASSPAGLLVFGDSEVLLATGDPDSADFRVTPISSTVGCDAGTVPARLGGIVFTVSKGRIYALNLGYGSEGFQSTITDITRDMVQPITYQTGSFQGGGGFRRVVADARHNHLLAVRQHYSGEERYYRFDVNTMSWLTDSQSVSAPYQLFHIPTSNSWGMVYLTDNSSAQEMWYLTGENQSDFELEFRDLNIGDPTIRKLFRRVHVYGRGLGVLKPGVFPLEYMTAPTLQYKTEYLAGDHTTNPGEITGTIEGNMVEPEHWVFTFPAGVTGNKLWFKLAGGISFWDADEYGYLESPIVVEYETRYGDTL